MTITPNQLPNRVSNFIAYGPEERAANPISEGDVITVRPQVYVRYFPGIVVSDLKEGGRGGNREGLLTVSFDPASVGFSNAISAHMNNDDRTVAMLRHSWENKVPVALAIETQRKKKNSVTGAPISPLAPIHALRGAEHPNGDGDNLSMIGPSGENTSNRVAFVNGQGTQHLQSNPADWKALVNNKSGDLPPEGWRNFAPGDDWKAVGAVVRINAPTQPQTSAPAHGSGFPTPDQLSTLMQSAVAQALKEFTPSLAGQPTQGGAPVGRPSGKFDEGKPWNPRTSDGRINLGGYVVSSERWVFEWSYRHLTEDLKIEASPEDAWTLAETVLRMASEVQSNAYGHGFVSDRTQASHREAEHWVQWAIEHSHPYPSIDADEETLSGWVEEVVAEASSHLTEAGRRAGEYFSAVSKRDKNGAAPQVQKTEEPSGPSEKVVRAFLDVIQRGWENPETIKNLGAQGRDSGYGALTVSMTSTDEGVQIAYPAVEGQPTGPLETLLVHRLKALNTAGAAPESSNTQPEPTPSQEPQATPPAPAAQNAPPETPAPSASVAQAPGHADSIIERLKSVADDQVLRDIYEEARDANLLATQVFVAPGPHGEVLFGHEGQEGFQPQNIGSVIGIIRSTFGSVSRNQGTATSKEASPAPQEEHAPAPQAEPQESAHAHTEVAEVVPEASTQAHESAGENPDSEDAQGIADAAGTATDLEEIAVLRQESENKGLLNAVVMVNGTEGELGLWLSHQERRVTRAQRKK